MTEHEALHSAASDAGVSGRGQAPRSRQRQARIFKVVNVPMRAILGLPVATPLGRSLMLATITGRKTGRTYRQPVSYVRDGEVLLTPGGGRWKLNLKPDVPVWLRIRGRDVIATPELVSDLSEVDRLLGIMTVANPRSAGFIGISRGADGHFDRAGLENAVSHGFRVVRWHPGETDY
jgi:hypothetical protein